MLDRLLVKADRVTTRLRNRRVTPLTFATPIALTPRFIQARLHLLFTFIAIRTCYHPSILAISFCFTTPVGDVKRALAWMKTHAADYQVNPDRVVLIGASAGGHLALLAAYAPDHPQLTPPDVHGCDLSVRAVVSYYGPSDLYAVYEHTRQQRVIGLPKVEIGLPGAAKMKKTMQDAGRLDILLGGHLHEVPAVYELASPVTHVHSGCPPTLLISADLDLVTPTTAARTLHQRLLDCGVPTIHIVYPLAQHGFDLLLPPVSPPRPGRPV